MNNYDFDHTLRQRHAEAITHLSAHTQAQLHNRLASAVAPRRPAHRMAWAAAAACAALFALAIGLQLPSQPTTASSQTTAATAVARDRLDGDMTFATLDENPDLYLWLASNDAVALAAE